MGAKQIHVFPKHQEDQVLFPQDGETPHNNPSGKLMIDKDHKKIIKTLTSPITAIMVTKMVMQKRTTIGTYHNLSKIMVGKTLINSKLEVNTDTIITTPSLMDKIQTKQIINHLLKVMEINTYNKIGTIQLLNKNPIINLQILQIKIFLKISLIWPLRNKSTKSKAVVANVPINLKTHQTHFIRIMQMIQNPV